MLKRKDGAKTQQALFDAACRIFGERGYHGATLAEICEAAGANIASVNYHFGSKEELYRAVCAYALQEIKARFPLSLERTGPPEQRLHAYLNTLLARSEDGHRWGFYHGLRMHEFREASGVADDLWQPWFTQHRDALIEILRALLGDAATPDTLRRCELSVMGPCFMETFRRTKPYRPAMTSLPNEEADALVEHIVRFALAGIRAIREAANLPLAANR